MSASWEYIGRAMWFDLFGTQRILDAIETRCSFVLQRLNRLEQTIMSSLDTLKTEVSETKTVMASAVTLLQGLKQKLDDAIASGDPAELDKLSAELDSETNALAAAVSANTPAEKT